MTPTRKRRLYGVTFLLLGVGAAVALTLTALQENLSFFYDPTQVANGEAPAERPFRVGGMVLAGSVEREPGTLKVAFTLTDYESDIRVHYEGILPDLFRENQGIVVQGKCGTQGQVVASEVFAKHDENYMSPEIAEALRKRGRHPDQLRDAAQQAVAKLRVAGKCTGAKA